MNNMSVKPYLVGILVFAVCEYLAYVAYSGETLGVSGRRGRAIADLVNWLVLKVGSMPAAGILAVAGLALAFIAFKAAAPKAQVEA